MEISCGLFGMAKALNDDFKKGMRDLAEAGFTAVEPVLMLSDSDLFPPELPEFVKSVLWNEEMVLWAKQYIKTLGMEISSGHISLGLTGGGKNINEFINRIVSFSNHTGIKKFVTSTRFTTAKECKGLARVFNTLTKRLKQYDIDLYYHNHEMEMGFFNIDGKLMMGLEYFILLTDPEVKIEFDVGWALYGNCNPVEFIQKYSERIAAIHLKDIVSNYNQVERENLFAAVGSGVLPTKEIVELSKSINLIPYGLMIDQDGPSEGNLLIDDLRKGILFIEKIR